MCRPGDTVEVEAVVTNASDETIEYWLPMSTPELHLEIRAKIGNDAFEFPDIDVYGKPGDTAIGHGSLAPGASYTQKMRFYAGSAAEGSKRRRLERSRKNARLFRALCGHSRVPVG